MPGRFEATVVIDRPIEQVFDSHADDFAHRIKVAVEGS
jgi:uncharacterized protein YndB with AHSA1/START domain